MIGAVFARQLGQAIERLSRRHLDEVIAGALDLARADGLGATLDGSDVVVRGGGRRGGVPDVAALAFVEAVRARAGRRPW